MSDIIALSVRLFSAKFANKLWLVRQCGRDGRHSMSLSVMFKYLRSNLTGEEAAREGALKYARMVEIPEMSLQ